MPSDTPSLRRIGLSCLFANVQTRPIVSVCGSGPKSWSMVCAAARGDAAVSAAGRRGAADCRSRRQRWPGLNPRSRTRCCELRALLGRHVLHPLLKPLAPLVDRRCAADPPPRCRCRWLEAFARLATPSPVAAPAAGCPCVPVGPDAPAPGVVGGAVAVSAARLVGLAARAGPPARAPRTCRWSAGTAAPSSARARRPRGARSRWSRSPSCPASVSARGSARR